MDRSGNWFIPVGEMLRSGNFGLHEVRRRIRTDLLELVMFRRVRNGQQFRAATAAAMPYTPLASDYGEEGQRLSLPSPPRAEWSRKSLEAVNDQQASLPLDKAQRLNNPTLCGDPSP